MAEKLVKRRGLIVWLNSNKYVNKLKRFGLIHYVSKKMKYVVLYVDHNQVDEKVTALEKLTFVQKVEASYNRNLDITYDGLLEELDKEAKEKNRLAKEEANNYFLKNQGD